MTIKFWTIRLHIQLQERSELGDTSAPSDATVVISMSTDGNCTLSEAATLFGERMESALKLVDIGDET